MSAFRLSLILLFCAATAQAQDISTAVVPVVGNVFGVSAARWLTDVELSNDTAFPIDVALELATAPEAPPILFTLSPGQSQRFPDVVGQAFGLDTALSPLRITSSRRRGVRVRAHAYAVQHGNVSRPQPLDVYSGTTYFPVRILDGLAFSDAFRTNIGLVNLGEEPADFVLAVQRIPGRNVAVAHMRVGPGSIVHAAIQALFPLITEGNGFSVVIETAARETHVYASVVENETNTGRFVPARIGPR
jgi:hypothetical protein